MATVLMGFVDITGPGPETKTKQWPVPVPVALENQLRQGKGGEGSNEQESCCPVAVWCEPQSTVGFRVIWKGDKLIDGVPQTLDVLRSMGKKLVFVTNNSTKSRSQYAHKFTSLGLSVTQDEIFSSSFAAAMYLKVNHFPPQNKVRFDIAFQLADMERFASVKTQGAGCMVGAICGSTGREPIVVGKPSTFMMDFLLQK
ncbi:HAD-superfamily hydrolase, subfamily IIA [Corchorus olitorius]|uniref:HAD-superfamily hydrolase, subfamily IIA n=1 Tax=Corchorus olitorius TaxID=93759 RepID=A0A1R3H2S0_9ROSI|nr:HAD-superfamily hydrolase, subfamily IIA [Corchorus olitorius]